MSPLHRSACFRLLCGLALTGVLAVGCGHKETATHQPTPTQETPAAAPAPAAAPMAAPVVQETGVDGRLREAQAAQQAGNYEKAADILIGLQQQPKQLNSQQAAALTTQMRQLQKELAGAAAGGDPRARAAADKLRRAAMSQ